MTIRAERAAPLRVLLVDDTPDLCELLTDALERTGDYEVVAVAANGLLGVQQAGRHDLDLVLLDIAMPVMDGLEALPMVRRLRPHATVVMLSGYGPTERAGMAAEGGAHGYLQKGEPFPVLLSRLHDIIDTAQSARAETA